MKKIISFVAVFVLLFICPVSVAADEAIYNTAGDLYQAWYDNMPDYICGVWSTDGGMSNLTFGIQNTEEGNVGKEEILSLIKDDTSVSFVYQKYSRNYLLQIQEELFEYLSCETGLIMTGVDEIENCLDIGIYKEKKDDPETIKMIDGLKEKYGDAIQIGYTGLVTTLEVKLNDISTDIEYAINEQIYTHPVVKMLIFLTVAMAAMLVVFAVFIARKRHSLIVQTNSGKIVSVESSLTTREIEDMVKESTISPPSSAYGKIVDKINKKDE